VWNYRKYFRKVPKFSRLFGRASIFFGTFSIVFGAPSERFGSFRKLMKVSIVFRAFQKGYDNLLKGFEN
jgi:hypothetical protein